MCGIAGLAGFSDRGDAQHRVRRQSIQSRAIPGDLGRAGAHRLQVLIQRQSGGGINARLASPRIPERFTIKV